MQTFKETIPDLNLFISQSCQRSSVSLVHSVQFSPTFFALDNSEIQINSGKNRLIYLSIINQLLGFLFETF